MKMHNEKGHLNIFKRDHESVITGLGKHDRVVAFLPNHEGLYVRVDHLWKLGCPTPKEILKAAKAVNGFSISANIGKTGLALIIISNDHK